MEYNYAYFDRHFYHQIKGTATGTNFAVVGANLVVAFKEVHLFQLLPEIYPQDFVDFVIRNYFRFLDDICHKWLKHFDIEDFKKIINEMDPLLKFLMDEIKDQTSFLDVKIIVHNNELQFDIYHKPTNAFGYLRYTSCHPPHTKKNIAQSLGKRIVRIVSHNRQNRLNELHKHLIDRDHPNDVIKYSMSKIFQPTQRDNNKELTPFIYTFNPNHCFNRETIKDCLKKSNHPKIKRVFSKSNVVIATRQPKNLKKMLTRAKFELSPIIIPQKPAGLYPCGNCTYCARGYIIPATEFTIPCRNSVITWTYTRYFSCQSMNVLYILKNDYDNDFYLGKTKNVKTRVAKHISDVFHPENSNCRELCEHLRKITNMVEPFFRYYPFFYADDPGVRDFMEKRFTRRFKPKLNSYNIKK